MELSKEQKREYNTVVLAALLHDIGKFLNRIKGIKEKHPLSSVRFIEETKIKNIVLKDEMDINLNLLKTLVQRHHESKRYFPPDQLVQEIKNDHEKALAYIVARSDNFSSAERDDAEDEKGDGYKKSRLYSLFSLINIKEKKKEEKYYQLQDFLPENIFPIDKETLDRDEYSYKKLYDKFLDKLEKLSPNNFSELFNGLWSIIKKYLWAVPSDTKKKRADITLLDHLSTTSAIAACLYLFHKEKIDEVEIKNDKKDKFLLVGGDLSGIQDFLFEINQRNPKKLSKTLRGRSFLLSLLVETTALKIIKTLNLPFSAKLMSSGGRFIILAPNTEIVKKNLKLLAEEIEKEFFKTFLGKLTLTLDFSIAINGSDFKLGRIKNCINRTNENLIKKKLNKNIHVLKGGDFIEILKQPHEKSLQKLHVCSFCGIYPKQRTGEEEKCKICNWSEALGEKILSKQYLIFTEGPGFLRFLDIGIDLANEYKPNIFSYTFEDILDSKPYHGSIHYNISNYLPKNKDHMIEKHNENEKSLCRYCKKNDLDKECNQDDRQTFQKSHLSFQCIATYSPFERQGKGVDKLAIFKADIDNLGYLIQYGFDKLDDEEKSKYSVSRYSFLSRMIDAFFQYWLKNTIAEKFPMIYTVYSGGDDLLLIGPWSEIIKFAYEFYCKFKEFVGNNPDITLSAGISLFSPHSPVTTAVEKADSYLEISKEKKGKDRLTLFDTTVKWEKLPDLFEYTNFLDEKVNDEESGMKTAFLYRLFKYRRMFIDAEDEGRIEGLRFHSLMNYDITRNIKKLKMIKKEGKEEILIQNEEEVSKLLPLCSTGNALNKELMRNLKIPLFIALFKNRGGKKNG